MKNITQSLYFVLCLTATLLIGGTAAADAQTASGEKSVKSIFTELVRAKHSDKPFVLLTPDDLSKLSPAELQSVVYGDPCDTATQISINQTVNGQLTSGDCRLEDNSYADFYTFNGASGQNITVTMNSSAFDTYLGLANAAGTFVLEDDDGGGGTNSRINTVLPATGLYVILANSALPNQFGNYALSLSAFAACTYSINPTSATIAPEGGTFSFAINTQPGCQWAASAGSSSFLSTSSTGTGTGTVTYTATPNGFNGTRTGTITAAGRTFTVTQPPINCTFSLNPTSVTAPATGTISSFAVNTQPGCYWSATYSGYFISTNSYGTGPGTVEYLVTTNNGADRSGTITVGGQVFTINQPGLNCTFAVSPTTIVVDRFENYGSINITTQPGCLWSANRSAFWVDIDPAAGTGSGVIYYRIYPNQLTVARTTVIAVYGQELIRVNITQNGSSTRTKFDFDHDGRADMSIFRPADGTWYVSQSHNGLTQFRFGNASDKLVPADYDGDGKTDVAVYRSGAWYIQRSQLGYKTVNFGNADDIPVPADYNLDGQDDIAVYRPSNGTWYVYSLFNDNLMFNPVQFGVGTDKPVVRDYDGDGKADYAVYRPSNGTWYLQQSQAGFAAVQFGNSEDKPVPADYDGDGKADIAVFRPSNGTWYLNRSQTGFTGINFGLSSDAPVPADYDGDGKADVAVFRNGNWYLNNSAQGFSSVAFGTATDKPVANAFVP